MSEALAQVRQPAPASLVWLLFALCLLGACTQRERPLRVAAASDLQGPLSELAVLFKEQGRREVVFSFGASGLLTHQIESGAPFDLFAAASKGYIDRLEARHLTVGKQRPYGRGRLLLWSSRPLSGLLDLADPAIGRIALANPEHAPYGLAAQQALSRSGVLPTLTGRLLIADSARQAAKYASSGEAGAALLPATSTPPGHVLSVPTDLYDPILHTAAALDKGDTEAAARFLDLLCGERGQAVLAKGGLLPP